MRKIADYTILFLLNAVEMVLELVAARLMSPYFGNSNFVWTAIIGIILLAMSLGNLLGGKISSAKNPRFIVGILLLIASIYITVTPLVDAPILKSLQLTNTSIQILSVISSIIFFLIPSTILGTITPVIMKERIGESNDQGKESGRITAIISIGSLFGTFFGGFFFIPTFGTKTIFSILGLIIIPLAILFQTKTGLKKATAVFVAFSIIAAAVGIFSFSSVVKNPASENISIDTEYGRIIIEEGIVAGEPVRYYKQSGAYASATFLNDYKKYDLVQTYLSKYDLMFNFLDVKNTAMIGGAAYQYPKFFISHYKDRTMDVIEIDPKSTEIAKQYFFLDDLIRDYGNERLGLYNEDGRIFLSNTTKKYDAILNDAFSGEVPVGTLATVEAAKIIKSHLNENGVYMSNVLGSDNHEKGKFLHAEIKTLKTVFNHVYTIPLYRNNYSSDKYLNWMVIATDNNSYKPNQAVELSLEDNDIVLTDDYNPVDSLVQTNYYD